LSNRTAWRRFQATLARLATMPMECLIPTRYKAIIGEDSVQRGHNASGRCSGLKEAA
jgi:hypothetical protein